MQNLSCIHTENIPGSSRTANNTFSFRLSPLDNEAHRGIGTQLLH